MAPEKPAPGRADPVQSALAAMLCATLDADPARISRSRRLREHLGILSPYLIHVACAAKDRFGVRIPDDDLERLVTLGDAVDFLRVAGAED